jgi:hypothetical protein
VLLVATLTGFAVGMGSEQPAHTRSASSALSTALPLRVPEVEVTITARATPTPSPAASPSLAPESAAQRDRELALVAARAGSAVDGAGSMSTPMAVPTLVPDAAATDPAQADPAPATPTTVASTTPSAATPATSTADFVLSSFNVLGASHTRNGGRGRATGAVRIKGAAALLSRHAVDVAGFQELQAEQARGLLTATGGTWSLYPGPGRGLDSENSVGWRSAKFRLVRGTTMSIPYFNGHHRNMPVVLLEDRASGVRAWFGNFHNPAETSQYHHQQTWRTQATVLEAALAQRTAATGVPLFVTGDMNERASYFCRFTGAAPSMVAAHGGSNGSGGCSAGRPRAVDWIFGSRGVTFSGYDEDRTHLVDITTDHPVVSTRVRISSSVFPHSLSAS